MEPIRLFDDQAEVLLKAQSHIANGKKVVIQMPPGSGKTVMAAELIELNKDDNRIWFVCHRREIVRQTSANVFQRYGIEHSIIAPGYETDETAGIMIASIPTLRVRKGMYKSPDMIIWDECHHIPAESWSKLMAQFPDAKHVGLTATPERLDGRGLSPWFDELVCGPSISDLIKLGRLADYRIFIPSEPDLTKARIQAGDYHKSDIDRIMGTPVVIGDALEHYRRHADGCSAIIFAPSVRASKELAAKFSENGIPAAHIDGEMRIRGRDRAVNALRNGEVKVLSNFGVLTEGFDAPAVDCVILMRPTRSLALYLQMIGRGLRQNNDKGNAVILDHAGLFHDHGDPKYGWKWTLDGGARRERRQQSQDNPERYRTCPECSHAHVPSDACPNCGFEYPSGSAVSEFDGILFEVVRGADEGCVSKRIFAAYIGKTEAAVRGMAERGLPLTATGLVILADGLEWCRENGVFVPDGYVTQADFARAIGRKPGVVGHWVQRRAIPTDGFGRIHLIDGTNWYRNEKIFHGNEKDNSHDGAISFQKFGQRNGYSSREISILIKSGMPIKVIGVRKFCIESECIRWLESHSDIVTGLRERGNRLLGGLPGAVIDALDISDVNSVDLVTPTVFAEMLQVSRQRVDQLIKKSGMPTVEINGRRLVEVSVAKRWLNDRKINRRKKISASRGFVFGVSSVGGFLGVGRSTVQKLITEGRINPLPTNYKKMIKVRESELVALRTKLASKSKRKKDKSLRVESARAVIEDAPKDESKEIKMDRSALYREVWAFPARDVADRHGITIQKLKELCVAMNVPMPTADFWARKERGEPVVRYRLPKERKRGPCGA